MRFASLKRGGENPFSDVVEGAWYYDYVVGAAAYGWINGYADGRFGIRDTITRAQAVTIINRMLGREADMDYVDAHADALNPFSDLTASHWAYYDIMEAANAHNYRKEDGGEDWAA